ncbi:hypothetical protein DFH09DRAFT_1332656 [Mycena vulgaris]|nr:hypothetical protein DFH09DRAFT_1332656 [Mycena vulgaris]
MARSPRVYLLSTHTSPSRIHAPVPPRARSVPFPASPHLNYPGALSLQIPPLHFLSPSPSPSHPAAHPVPSALHPPNPARSQPPPPPLRASLARPALSLCDGARASDPSLESHSRASESPRAQLQVLNPRQSQFKARLTARANSRLAPAHGCVVRSSGSNLNPDFSKFRTRISEIQVSNLNARARKCRSKSSRSQIQVSTPNFTSITSRLDSASGPSPSEIGAHPDSRCISPRSRVQVRVPRPRARKSTSQPFPNRRARRPNPPLLESACPVFALTNPRARNSESTRITSRLEVPGQLKCIQA